LADKEGVGSARLGVGKLLAQVKGSRTKPIRSYPVR
jgi:hypothetical protein